MEERQPAFRSSEKRRHDFGIIGRAEENGAAAFVSGLPLQRGARLLDLGCGTGNVSVAAARAGADVTGVDPREPHLSRGRAWAKNEGLLVRFKPAPYEKLPFSDGNFHAVTCFHDLPFADDPAATAAEMRRVCRPRGLLAVTAWEPNGLIGDMLRLAYGYSGDDRLTRALDLCEPDRLMDLLGERPGTSAADPRRMTLDFPFPPRDVASCYLEFHPPLRRTAESLDPDARQALATEISDLWQRAADSTDGGTRATAGYRALILEPTR